MNSSGKKQMPSEENKGSEMNQPSQNLQFQEMSSEQSSKTLGT